MNTRTLLRAVTTLGTGVASACIAIAASRHVQAADVPKTMAYQARLTDGNNVPLTGTFGMQVGIWTAAASGQALCAESHSEVNVLDGTFQLVIGTGVAAGSQRACGARLQEIFAAHPQAYLQVEVDGEPLAPRAEIHSVGQAFHAAIAEQLAQPARDLLVPPGSVIAYAGVTPPPGWEACDGSLKPISDPKYGALYKAIGKAHGGTASEFRLPDYRGRFLRGVDDGQGKDKGLASRYAPNPGGNNAGVGSVQDDNTGPHTHPIDDPGHSHGLYHQNGWGNWSYGGNNWALTVRDPPQTSTTHVRTSITVLTNSGIESRPANAAVVYIIKL